MGCQQKKHPIYLLPYPQSNHFFSILYICLTSKFIQEFVLTKQNYKKRPYLITSREHNIQLMLEKRTITNEVKIQAKNYMFDKVFDTDYKNAAIYNEMGFMLVSNLLKQQNSVLYVYGQTGSGKTYSLFGDENNMGLLEMLLLDLSRSCSDIVYNGVQIYNNKCYDIFTKKELKECEQSDGSIEFLNIESFHLHKFNDNTTRDDIIHNVGNVIDNIKSARYVGVSSSNKTSSRSHLLFQVKCGNNYIKIVDLAGSERACRSKHNEEHNFRENANINLGILAIKECIRSSTCHSKKVPYRNSKITKILKETFCTSVNTFVLATMSPLKEDIVDTKDTLKYISEFKKVKNRSPTLKPIGQKGKLAINKCNMKLNNALDKQQFEQTKILKLIEDNISSLRDLHADIKKV